MNSSTSGTLALHRNLTLIMLILRTSWFGLGLGRYVPTDVYGNAVSLTLEYSFDYWALGTLGHALQMADSQVFLNRSLNYANTWDPSTQYFCGKTTAGVSLSHCFPL